MNRDLVKMGLFVLMAWDHVVFVWYPGHIWAALPGRVVFPAFVWLIVVGVQKTHDRGLYLGSLVMLAMVSQSVWVWVFQSDRMNDIWGLVVVCAGVMLHIGMVRWVPLALVGGLSVLSGFVPGCLGSLTAVAVLLTEDRLPCLGLGVRGLRKYWFYVAYPVHLGVIGVVRLATTGL